MALAERSNDGGAARFQVDEIPPFRPARGAPVGMTPVVDEAAPYTTKGHPVEPWRGQGFGALPRMTIIGSSNNPIKLKHDVISTHAYAKAAADRRSEQSERSGEISSASIQPPMAKRSNGGGAACFQLDGVPPFRPATGTPVFGMTPIADGPLIFPSKSWLINRLRWVEGTKIPFQHHNPSSFTHSGY